MPIAMDISKPLMRASYYVSLLVTGKSNITDVWKDWPFRLIRITSVPDLFIVVDPSTNSSHGGLVELPTSDGNVSSVGEYFA